MPIAGQSEPLSLENSNFVGSKRLKIQWDRYRNLFVLQAISYMQEDLVVAKQLGDTIGECRAHGNLGSAYFSKANFKVGILFLMVFKCIYILSMPPTPPPNLLNNA